MVIIEVQVQIVFISAFILGVHLAIANILKLPSCTSLAQYSNLVRTFRSKRSLTD